MESNGRGLRPSLFTSACPTCPKSRSKSKTAPDRHINTTISPNGTDSQRCNCLKNFLFITNYFVPEIISSYVVSGRFPDLSRLFVPSQSKRPVASCKNDCSKMLKSCIIKAGFTVAGTVPVSHRIPSHRLEKADSPDYTANLLKNSHSSPSLLKNK